MENKIIKNILFEIKNIVSNKTLMCMDKKSINLY